MSNRVNVEISANVQGYVQGIDKATQSAEKYETEQRKVADSVIAFTKEVGKSKRSARDLAASYAELSAEIKASQFGKEMEKQLDIATEAAVKFIDRNSDINEALKRRADDNYTFNALSDGLELATSSYSALSGVIATFTGNEEDAKRAVVAFTTAQSVLNTVTKMHSLTLGQNNIMLKINDLQKWAAKKATDAQTAATGRATIAQKAFNAVAKANPYVLLATAIFTLIGAVGAYTIATSKAAEQEKTITKELSAHQKAIEDVNNTYSSKYSNTLSNLMSKYVVLQESYKKLKTEHEKTEWIKSYNKALKEVGGTIKTISDAEDFLINNTDKVKAAFIARATAAAKYAKLQDLLLKKYEAEEAARRAASKNNFTENSRVLTQDVDRYNLMEGVDYTKNKNKIGEYILTAAGAIKMNLESSTRAINNAGKEFDDQINTLVDSIAEDSDAINSILGDVGSGSNNKPPKGIQAMAGSIADITKQISTLQEQARTGTLPDDLKDPAKYKAKLEELQNILKDLKITWGFEEPDTKLQELQKKLDDAEKAYILAVEADDESAKEEAEKAYRTAENELNEHKLKIKIEPVMDPTTIDRNLKNISESLSEALTPIQEPKYNFSNIPEEFSKQADKTLKQYDKLEEAKKKFQETKDNNKNNPEIAEAAQRAIDTINEQEEALIKELDIYQDLDDATEKRQKKLEKMRNTLSKVGEAAQAVGQMFSTLGDTANDETTKVLGIVAQAVATTALAFADALGKDQTTKGNIWAFVAASIASTAAMISMISQIKAATSGFANGGIFGDGIISGSSYSGDRILARVNSGEMILNKRQQRNLFDMLDTGAMPNSNGTKVEVVGKISGTDILLVSKNTNKMLSKAGSKINI